MNSRDHINDGSEAWTRKYRFAPFELTLVDSESIVLSEGSEKVPLTLAPAKLLLYLIDHRDRPVKKVVELWPLLPGKNKKTDPAGKENAVATQLKAIRKALRDNHKSPTYIASDDDRDGSVRFIFDDVVVVDNSGTTDTQKTQSLVRTTSPKPSDRNGLVLHPCIDVVATPAGNEQRVPERPRTIPRPGLKWASVAIVAFTLGIAYWFVSPRLNPGLPVKHHQFTILLADFEQEGGSNNFSLTSTLFQKLTDACAQIPNVAVEPLGKSIPWRQGVEEGERTAEREGRNRKADLIIWGTFNNTGPSVLFAPRFKLLNVVKATGVEPIDFSYSGRYIDHWWAVAPTEHLENAFLMHATLSAMITYSVGSAYWAFGDQAGALAFYERAYAETMSSRENVAIAMAGSLLGQAYLRLNRLDASLAVLTQSLEAASQVGKEPERLSHPPIGDLMAGMKTSKCMILLAQEHIEDSERECREALQVGLDADVKRLASLVLASVLNANQQWLASLKLIEQSLPDLTKDYWCIPLMTRALSNYELGNTTLAMTEIEKAQECKSLASTARYRKALMLYRRMDFDGARKEFEAVVALGDDSGRLGRAFTNLALGRADAASSDCNFVASHFNDSRSKSAVNWCQARSLLLTKSIAEARGAFERASLSTKAAGPWYEDCGAALPRDIGIAECDILILIQPQNMSARISRIKLLISSGKSPPALQEIDYIVTTAPGTPLAAEAYVLRARLFASMQENSRAVVDFDRAVSSAPNSPSILYARGAYYAEQGDLTKAATDYTAAIHADPGYYPAYADRSGVFGDLGQPRECIVDTDKALQLNPNSARAFNNRAMCLMSLGKAHEALASASNAAKALSSKEVLDTLGRAHYLTGDWVSASSDFERALKLDPHYVSALIGRARLQRKNGNIENARQDLEHAHEGLRKGSALEKEWLGEQAELSKALRAAEH